MKLVIVDGKIQAYYPDRERVETLDAYEGVDVVCVPDSALVGIPLVGEKEAQADDPRPSIDNADLYNGIRKMRTQLLNDCSWTQDGDTALSAEDVTEAATYRTALRNVVANTADPKATVTWPPKPAWFTNDNVI